MGQQTAAPVAEQSYSKPAPPQPDPPQAHVDKTELDLEIEKYQKEIEDKQRRARSIQSSQAPQQQEQARPRHLNSAPPSLHRKREATTLRFAGSRRSDTTVSSPAGHRHV